MAVKQDAIVTYFRPGGPDAGQHVGDRPSLLAGRAGDHAEGHLARSALSACSRVFLRRRAAFRTGSGSAASESCWILFPLIPAAAEVAGIAASDGA